MAWIENRIVLCEISMSIPLWSYGLKQEFKWNMPQAFPLIPEQLLALTQHTRTHARTHTHTHTHFAIYPLDVLLSVLCNLCTIQIGTERLFIILLPIIIYNPKPSLSPLQKWTCCVLVFILLAVLFEDVCLLLKMCQIPWMVMLQKRKINKRKKIFFLCS